MQKSRFLTIAAVAMVGAIAPMILTRTSPTAKRVRAVQEAYQNAERPVLRPGSGTREVEQFMGDLKEIDSSGLPPEVEQAFVRMIVAVEANFHVRTAGGDTNAIDAANERVAEAKRELVRMFDRYRGHMD